VRGRTRQFARFAVAGAAGYAVDVGLLYVLLGLGAGVFSGRLVSFLCAVWSTWYINRRVAFRTARRTSAWQEWWTYLPAMLPGAGVNYVIYSALVATLPEHVLVPGLAVTAGAAVGLLVNFAMARRVVFRSPSRDRSE
jgi:putative flippase GtrA